MNLIHHVRCRIPPSDCGVLPHLLVSVFPNTLQGLQVEERDGFRYYQYDWSVVGGKPTSLSTEDIDSALDGAP